MKKIFFAAITIFFISTEALAQLNLPAVDKSPLDICYFPDNYPLLKMQGKANSPVCARVIYSRPKKEGRAVFGGLVSYGKVWRMGANEATEIEFYKPATIAGKKIAPGRYTLYAMVNENSWTFIINRDNDTWGAFVYDSTKDIARASVSVEKINESVEYLSMTFAKTNDNSANLVVAWENTKATLPINF